MGGINGGHGSHVAAGDGAGTLVAPLNFTDLATASWSLLPRIRSCRGGPIVSGSVAIHRARGPAFLC